VLIARSYFNPQKLSKQLLITKANRRPNLSADTVHVGGKDTVKRKIDQWFQIFRTNAKYESHNRYLLFSFDFNSCHSF